MSGPQPVDLATALDALNYQPDEYMQLCYQLPGQPFATTVVTAGSLSGNLAGDRNFWFGVNPTAGPARVNAGRGGAAQVTRLAGIWVDLDLISEHKTVGCPDIETAMAVIDDLSAALGQRPTLLTFSGHGAQPIWAVEDGLIVDLGTHLAPISRHEAAALLRRWGRLVANIADRRGCQVDSLYDLPRVLRAPGSVNWKYPTQPVQVVTYRDTGGPLTVDHINAVLLEHDIPQMTDDGTDPGVIVSAPAEWSPSGDNTCPYAAKVIAGWATDTPAQRHPWLIAQATRLAAMKRNGCLTAADWQAAEHTLTARFAALVSAAGDRGATPGEIRGALTWGVETAATFTAEHLARELGSHLHHNAPGERPPVEISTTPRRLTLVPPPPADGNLAVVAPPPPDPGPVAVVQMGALTDQSNADLMTQRHKDQLRWAPSMNSWLRWAGHRWVLCEDDGEALTAAVETVRSIQPANDEQRKHKIRSLSRRGIEAAAQLSRRHPDIRVTADQLDSDPYLLNTPTGLVDLRTGRLLRPTTPDDLITKATAAAYQPGVDAPRWRQFLIETFSHDTTLADYVQRLAGYSAVGVVTEHILPFLHGPGGNGKSVLLDVIIGVLGDYATTAPQGFLLAGGRDDESATARLKGCRLVVASEVSQSARFDEAKVKLLTGGDKLTARHLFAKHMTFTPSHTLWLMGNHQPRVDAGGESFWRRLRLIPFAHTVPREQRQPGLAAHILATESAGVLNWIIEGARLALTDGIHDPAGVVAATQLYALEEDSLARFMVDRCVVGGGEHVRVDTAVMRAAYESWCAGEGEKPVSPQTFGRELRTRWGVDSMRSNGRRFYVNMHLLPDPAAPQWRQWGPPTVPPPIETQPELQ